MARSDNACRELRRIADIIGSRLVMGHWPHMKADKDRQILLGCANIIESLDRELTAVAEFGHQLMRAELGKSEVQK